MVRHWKRLPTEAVDAPTLSVFADRLHNALSNLVAQVSLPAAGEFRTG